jgi:hypothetical protein
MSADSNYASFDAGIDALKASLDAEVERIAKQYGKTQEEVLL